MYLCGCNQKNENHCQWPADFAFPRDTTNLFYHVPSDVNHSASVEFQDLKTLVDHRAWVASSVLNAFLVHFNSLTQESVYFTDAQVMINWVKKVEDLYKIKCCSMDGSEKGNDFFGQQCC